MKKLLILLVAASLYSCNTVRHIFPSKNKVEFTGKVVYQKTDFRDMSGLEVKKGEFYWSNVWFEESKVSVNSNNNLLIECVYEPKVHTDWQQSKKTEWTTGMVQTDFGMNYGTWIVMAKSPKCFPAIWLLRENYEHRTGFKTITPEIDIMEVIGGKFQHTLHYTPAKDKYSTVEKNTRFKYDSGWHEFAVNLLPDGYDFYTDGILTGRFRGSGDMVSNRRCYLLINNATHPRDNNDINTNYKFEIGSITIRENEYTFPDNSPFKK